MNALGEIEIHFEGKVGAQGLTPALVDIEEIREILGEAADLLFPTEKRSQRPVISYEMWCASDGRKPKCAVLAAHSILR